MSEEHSAVARQPSLAGSGVAMIATHNVWLSDEEIAAYHAWMAKHYRLAKPSRWGRFKQWLGRILRGVWQ